MTQERLDEADGNPRLSDRTAGVLAPRCFTKFQSGGKAIMSDPCMPTPVSEEKLGHPLDEEQNLQGAPK